MKNKTKRIAMIIMALVMVFTMVNPATAEAAKKPKLNKTAVTLKITNKTKKPSTTLKVKNGKKTPKWTTNNKKVVALKKVNKNTIKVTAKKAGKAMVVCNVNGKKLKCKVTVKDTRKDTNKPKDSETTGNSENTGNSETGDSEVNNGKTKPVCGYCCGTHMNPSGICGYIIWEYPGDTGEASKAMAKHLADHIYAGLIPQYGIVKPDDPTIPNDMKPWLQ